MEVLFVIIIIFALVAIGIKTNNNIAKKMLLRSANQLRLVFILAVLIQRKAQNVGRLIHTAILTVQRMDFLIVDNSYINFGLLRQLIQACYCLQALLQGLQHLRGKL